MRDAYALWKTLEKRPDTEEADQVLRAVRLVVSTSERTPDVPEGIYSRASTAVEQLKLRLKVDLAEVNCLLVAVTISSLLRSNCSNVAAPHSVTVV